MSDPRASQLEQAALGNPKVNQTSNHNILLFGFRSSQIYSVISTGPESSGSTVLAYAASVFLGVSNVPSFTTSDEEVCMGTIELIFEFMAFLNLIISPEKGIFGVEILSSGNFML